MSNKLVGLARWKRFERGDACSALVRKAVLCSLADLADDDGAGVFAAVPKIAAMAACSDRNVQLALAEFAEEGLIELVGQRSCRGGYTKEWRVNVAALRALPDIDKVVKPLRTSKRESGAAASPLSHEAGVVKELRTSPEVVKKSGLSGAGDSPKPFNPDATTDEGRPAYLIVVDAVNHPRLDPHKQHQLVTTSKKVEGWLRSGATLEDIIDTVRAVLARQSNAGPIRVWGYFDDAVRQAVSERLASEQDQPAIQPSTSRRAPSRSLTEEDQRIVAGLQGANLSAEAQRFIAEITGAAGASAIGRASLRARYRELYSEPDWAFRLDYFRTERHWPAQWGPQPGEPGYRGPSQHTATEGEAHP